MPCLACVQVLGGGGVLSSVLKGLRCCRGHWWSMQCAVCPCSPCTAVGKYQQSSSQQWSAHCVLLLELLPPAGMGTEHVDVSVCRWTESRQAGYDGVHCGGALHCGIEPRDGISHWLHQDQDSGQCPWCRLAATAGQAQHTSLTETAIGRQLVLCCHHLCRNEVVVA